MPIPESVRESAETLRQLGVEDESISIDWENAPQEVFEDVRRVLKWAIENLLDSDDDEPVTEEWLRKNGWPVIESYRGRQEVFAQKFDKLQVAVTPSLGDGAVTFYHNGIELLWIQSATRGQVRKLVSALKGE